MSSNDDVYMDPEEVAKRLVPPPPHFTPEQEQMIRKKMRRQLIIGALVGALGIAATAMGIIGQSFSYRSAHALERIGDQIEVLSKQRCAATP
jgi:hypothetical protein